MGATGAYMTPSKLIDDELGVGRGTEILAKARGKTEFGETENWRIVRWPDGKEEIVLALSHTSRRYGDTYSVVKIVNEGMGPASVDVPDKIWEKRPELPADGNAWAAEWRESVAKYRAHWPRWVKDLTDDDIGALFEIEGFTNYGAVEYRGRTAREARPLFRMDGRLTYPAGWRKRRIRPATKEAT